jgi:hypothetical protein
MTSYKPEVTVIHDNSGWVGNGVRFATRVEAEKAVADLKSRWLLVSDTRVVESDEPVNYRWDDELGKTVYVLPDHV